MVNISKNHWVLWIAICMVNRERNVIKYTKIIFLATLLFFFIQKIKAQQLPQFSQYTFNAFLLNPAAAGAEGYTAINLTNRAQWVGVEGAPLTGNVTIQTRIMKNDRKIKGSAEKRYLQPFHSGRVGMAGGFYYDRAGLIDQTSAFFTYAYHISTYKSQFSLGATLSLLQFKVNTNLLNNTEQQNIKLGNNKLLVYLPDVNVGAYYTNQNMFIGLSVLQLAQGSVHFQNYDNNNFVIYRHFYLTGGYKFELSEQSILEPSFFFKTSEELRPQMDVSLKLIFNNRFWMGIAYRTRATYITTIGLRVDRLYFGYAFDYSAVGILNSSNSSHELMIAIKLGDNTRRYKWMDRY